MKNADIVYPTVQELIEFNVIVLDSIKIKKADQNKVLSYQKIKNIIEGVKISDGDIYDKATYLMRQTVSQHAFASGNRRTAFIVSKFFLQSNNEAFNIPDNPDYARIMIGIPDNYRDDEIKNWIKNGNIREFKRH